MPLKANDLNCLEAILKCLMDITNQAMCGPSHTCKVRLDLISLALYLKNTVLNLGGKIDTDLKGSADIFYCEICKKFFLSDNFMKG